MQLYILFRILESPLSSSYRPPPITMQHAYFKTSEYQRRSMLVCGAWCCGTTISSIALGIVIYVSGDCIIPFFVEKKWRGLISRLFLQKWGICLPVNISSQFYNSPFLQNEIQLSIYVGKSCQWDSSNREAIFCSKNGELLPFGQSIQHKWTIIIVL